MGLDIWFPEDIRNALLAANEASTLTARVCAAIGEQEPEYGLVGEYGRDSVPYPYLLRAYMEGYRAALVTLALAFGLSPQILKMAVKGYERPIDGRTGDPGVLETTAGDCSGIRSPDGKGTDQGAGEAGRGNRDTTWR